MVKSIYIHIPFCIRKCLYCDFFSVLYNENIAKEYINALIKEINISSKDNSQEIETIYFGGGTPTSLDYPLILSVCSALKDNFNISDSAEITIEANPGTVGFNKLRELRHFFNRISFGVQSFNNNELKVLGRLHSSFEAKESIVKAKEAGFDNISLDLMYELPYQTIGTLKESVNTSINLGVKHISMYGLSFEEGTYFGNNKEKLTAFIDENVFYEEEIEILLNKSGIYKYEVSNYSRIGYEAKHNLTYWHNKEYYGFGAGAVGYINNTRYKNISDIEKYIQNIKNDSLKDIREYEEIVDNKDRAFENLMLGLRIVKGMDIKSVTDYLTKEECKGFYEAINRLNKYLILENDNLSATKAGMLILNSLIIDLAVWK